MMLCPVSAWLPNDRYFNIFDILHTHTHTRPYIYNILYGRIMYIVSIYIYIYIYIYAIHNIYDIPTKLSISMNYEQSYSKACVFFSQKITSN